MAADVERVGFTVVKNALVPADDEARAVMAKFDIGENVAVEAYRARDKTFATRAHFVFKRVADSYGMRIKNVRGWLAAKTGRADVVEINGQQVLVPWGTGPRDMSNDEFQAFFDDARCVIVAELLPKLRQDDRDDILRMIDTM